MKLLLSRQASQDLEEIYLYGFSKFGETQADRYAAKLESAFDTIAANPEIGRLDTRVKPAIRRFEVGSHIICYDLANGEILIVRILHKSMSFLKQL